MTTQAPTKPSVTSTEHTFKSWNGKEIFYRAWSPRRPSETNKALLLFHRGHEHSGRFQDFVERLGLEDYWIFAWDARGHGRTEGERGYAESFAALVRDVDAYVRHLEHQYDVPQRNMAVVANSIGAVLVSAWVHDYAPAIRALVLTTPALRVKLYVPLAIPALRLLNKVRRKSFVKSYVLPTMLTHDDDMIRDYAADPLVARDIAVNVLLEMHDASTRLMADASAICVPTLMLSGGSDWVVRQRPQKAFFDDLTSPVKEFERYDDFYHSVLQEHDRDRPIARIRTFLEQAFAQPSEPPSLVDADQRGYTKQAADALRRPLFPLSPRALYYGGMKLVLKTLGRMSAGVRLGWRTGFSSGESLDHVYRDQARGWSPLGRMADRLYLNSPGWIGIRQRKLLVEELLLQAVRDIDASGKPVRILDIASGPGRYVLDAIRRFPDIEFSALLRDLDEPALARGRAIAAERGLENVAFERGDALDEQSLAGMNPQPTVAIVSGLYELIPDNPPILASLRGLAAALEKDGLLIYTNQPWHPQQELIARALVGIDGEPWVMRCRTQVEMDQLVAAAGFEKLRTLATDNGIFTVSLARRVDSNS
ncbi:MAG: bifunctional alpha/beta hydrolase/class I SAM-dependent methyltransferase [Pirellulaceae bacterium]